MRDRRTLNQARLQAKQHKSLQQSADEALVELRTIWKKAKAQGWSSDELAEVCDVSPASVRMAWRNNGARAATPAKR